MGKVKAQQIIQEEMRMEYYSMFMEWVSNEIHGKGYDSKELNEMEEDPINKSSTVPSLIVPSEPLNNNNYNSTRRIR